MSPRMRTSIRIGIVRLDIDDGRGGRGGSRNRCIPNHFVLIDILLDKSMWTFKPLGIEDCILLLMKVCVLGLRESQGASAEEG